MGTKVSFHGWNATGYFRCCESVECLVNKLLSIINFFGMCLLGFPFGELFFSCLPNIATLMESKFASSEWDCYSLVSCNYTSNLKKSTACLLPFSLSTFLHDLCFPPAFPAQETTFLYCDKYQQDLYISHGLS